MEQIYPRLLDFNQNRIEAAMLAARSIARARGEFFLAPPTSRTLAISPVRRICTAPSHTSRFAVIDGPTRFVLRDARFVSEEAPPSARQSSPPSGDEN